MDTCLWGFAGSNKPRNIPVVGGDLQSQQAVPRPGLLPSRATSKVLGVCFLQGCSGLCFHIGSAVYAVSEKETTYNQVYTIHIHIQVYHIHVPVLRVRWPPPICIIFIYIYIIHTYVCTLQETNISHPGKGKKSSSKVPC